jgi:lipid-A-disaccharide synthase
VATEILLIAGEASADMHAAALVDQLRMRRPDLHFFGVGGPKLRARGMEVVAPAEALNVVGGSDWKDRWREVLRVFSNVKKQAGSRNVAAAILLDLPDFNLKLAKFLHSRNIPVLYYISPQVWAWRKYRIRKIKKFVDKMLVVFPFEKLFYEKHGVAVDFVGHPILEDLQPRLEYRHQDEVQLAPRVALLPGSRPSEIRHHAELLKETVKQVRRAHPGAIFKVPLAPTVDEAWARSFFSDAPDLELVTEDSRTVLTWADVALVASGTATLETALLGTPFALFYRVSRSSTFIIKYVLRYKNFFGMPNLLHGQEVVREFLHDRATPAALAAECNRMIEAFSYRQTIADKLTQCRDLLGRPGASARVAALVLKAIDNRRTSGFDLLPAYT